MTTSPQGPERITYEDKAHAYCLDGKPVPSVTTILDKCVSKPALTWWGMRVGLAALVRLMSSHSWPELANANTYDEILTGVPLPGSEHYNGKGKGKAKTLVELLTIREKLSTNHVRDDAGERGTIIHNAMEQLGLGVNVTVIQDAVPDEHAGYVAALCQWWLDHEPEFLEQEIIVASREHQYAGRFDMVVRYRTGPHAGKVVLADLKTSKSVYRSHLVQLDAYQLAYHEMDLVPPSVDPATWEGFDARHVIHVQKDGGYGITESRLPTGAFIPYVQLFRALEFEKAAHPELMG